MSDTKNEKPGAKVDAIQRLRWSLKYAEADSFLSISAQDARELLARIDSEFMYGHCGNSLPCETHDTARPIRDSIRKDNMKEIRKGWYR